MKRLFSCVIVGCLVAGAVQARSVREPRVQMAILLDTSGSMSGLIEQAKSQLWKFVNEFARAEKNGHRPRFELAIYEYGNDGLSRDKGYIRQVLGLTTDLDKVSEELFGLRTNGGSEFCGQVIQTALNELQWSDSHADYKAMFIAGNEPFTQGPVSFEKACRAAIAKGIMVNTIFCGAFGVGEQTRWKDGAVLADGRYMNIDHNAKVVHIVAPQDREIAELGRRLNATYIAYGKKGRKGLIRQEVQDTNAVRLSTAGAPVLRALSKASYHYKNTDWDLVDACKDGKLDLEKVSSEELPADMRSMTSKQRAAHVQRKQVERERIQKRIAELNTARQQYVAAEQKKLAEDGQNTLDEAVVETVRAQAETKEFIFR